MTRIRMLADAKGAADGFTVRTYVKGEVYPQPGFPMPDDLVAAFFDAGVCELADEPAADPQPDDGKVEGEPADVDQIATAVADEIAARPAAKPARSRRK